MESLLEQSRKLVVAGTLLTTLLLTACGGGGGGDSSPSQAAAVTPVPTPATLTGVFISEVGNNAYYNTAAWFEIYNKTGHAIDLASYSVRTRAINPDNGTPAAPAIETFALPHLTIPDQGRVVVASKVDPTLVNNSNVTYISDASGYVPSWSTAAGFVELLANGKTTDFVRFGSESTAPISSGMWIGANVPAFAKTSDVNGINTLSSSIVRLDSNFTQTHTSTDWTAVNFSTPGGPNDVGPGVVDSDADGIPDSAKVSGGTYSGIDLYSMGARPGQRDLFIQLDYMNSTDPGITPQQQALQNVVAAFRAHNIAVHFDAGNLFAAAFDPVNFNLSGAVSNKRALVPCTTVYSTSQCTDVNTIKSAAFDYRRKAMFRYLLMANSQNLDGSYSSSGVAELLGPDLVVTLGGWNLNTNNAANTNMLVNYQAATIMHELGHTLGLQHGGDESTNYKPNYYSVMNYMYQLYGLPKDPTGADQATNSNGLSEVNERYYLYSLSLQSNPPVQFVPGINNTAYYPAVMHDGPATTTFKMDYSDGTGALLDENLLNESLVIGRGAGANAYGDWDLNGHNTTGTYRFHIVDEGMDTSFTQMHDYNDWANLVLAINKYGVAHFNGASIKSASSALPSTPYDPVFNTRRPLAREDAPPALLIKHLRALNP